MGPGLGGSGAGASCVLTAELEVRQKREQIPAGTLLLAVEDPETRVGSGGATLNALLVAAEHLSARAGFTVSAPVVPLVPEWICVAAPSLGAFCPGLCQQGSSTLNRWSHLMSYTQPGSSSCTWLVERWAGCQAEGC